MSLGDVCDQVEESLVGARFLRMRCRGDGDFQPQGVTRRRVEFTGECHRSPPFERAMQERHHHFAQVLANKIERRDSNDCLLVKPEQLGKPLIGKRALIQWTWAKVGDHHRQVLENQADALDECQRFHPIQFDARRVCKVARVVTELRHPVALARQPHGWHRPIRPGRLDQMQRGLKVFLAMEVRDQFKARRLGQQGRPVFGAPSGCMQRFEGR
ncbi:hypothetical protein D9M68_789810 [compost metagenome]